MKIQINIKRKYKRNKHLKEEREGPQKRRMNVCKEYTMNNGKKIRRTESKKRELEVLINNK